MYKIMRHSRVESADHPQYCLTSLREDDIFLIRDWRNQQLDHLRQKAVITKEQQQSYYLNIIKPTFFEEQPKQMLFSYLKDNVCIGYGGLTHISWEDMRAEVSFLLDPQRVSDQELYKKEFAVFLELLKKVAFHDLKLNRLFTETYDLRPWHVEVIVNAGFKLEGTMREHTKIQGKYVNSLLHGILKEESK